MKLETQARLLKDSQYFTGLDDTYALLDKQEILLVLTGCKPMSETVSAHWVDVPGGRRSEPDDIAGVAQLVDSLGLYLRFLFDDYGYLVLVSEDRNLLDQYETADDSGVVGRLFGYPETAIHAFKAGELMNKDEMEKIQSAYGIDSIPGFVFSSRHWREELDVLLRWRHSLEKYGYV